MMIHGEIEVDDDGHFTLNVEVFGATASGPSYRVALARLIECIHEIANDDRPLGDFRVTIDNDGDKTLYVSSNDPARMTAMVLRQLRVGHGFSLEHAKEMLGAKSRTAYARYEQGVHEPGLSKLAELLAVVAPKFALAIVPRAAAVLPRWSTEWMDDAIRDQPEMAATLGLAKDRAEAIAAHREPYGSRSSAKAAAKRTKRTKPAARTKTTKPAARAARRVSREIGK